MKKTNTDKFVFMYTFFSILNILSALSFIFCLQDKGKATMYGSRRLHKDKKLDLLLMEDSDPDDSDPEDVKAMKSEEEFKKVKRMPGMYYKVRLSTTLT